MKKALMGTTALVAAAVTTGVVAADEMAEEGMMAEPISLTIGGRSHWGVAVFDNEAKPNDDDMRISNDVLLTFSGSTVLDSGIEVAIRIEVEGEKADDQGDAKFAEISGSFGAIRIGNDDPAAKKMATTAPYATYFYGINDNYWANSGNSVGSDPWMTTYADAGAGASAGFTYFSPVINGFQFGLSYAPEAGAEAESATADTSEGGDVYSVGARYDGAFGDAGVTIAAGYANKDVPEEKRTIAGSYVQEDGTVGADKTDDVVRKAVMPSPGRTVKEWAGGVVVSMSGVSVGGSMSVLDDDMGNDDLTQYDLGVMYGEGPWSVSANIGNQDDPDNMIDNDYARLLTNFNLGPGINLAGAIGVDSPNAGTNKGKDTSFAGVALGISF